jgi:hypothetical protein
VAFALHSVRIKQLVEDFSGHEKAQKAQKKSLCAACASLWRFRMFWLRLAAL